MRQQHDMNDIADDDARSGVIGELGIMVKAQRFVEGRGFGQVSHGQGDENESTHEKDGGLVFEVVSAGLPKQPVKSMTNVPGKRGQCGSLFPLGLAFPIKDAFSKPETLQVTGRAPNFRRLTTS
jgi:hypothetical protein